MTIDNESPAFLTMTPVETSVAESGVSSLEEYQSLVEDLSQEVSLVRVYVGRWRGNIPLKGAQVVIEGQTMTAGDGDVSTPSTCVMPDVWRRTFDRLESRLRRVVAKPPSVKIKSYTPYVKADGTTDYYETIVDEDHVLPRSVVPERRQEIADITVNDWREAVENFLAEYDNIIAAFKKDKPHLYETAKKHLPAGAGQVRAMFHVRFSERPLGYSADALSVEALQKGAGPYLDMLRESLIRENIERLQAACGGLVEKLQAGVDIKTVSLEGVRAAIGAFGDFGSLLGKNNGVNEALGKAAKLLDGLTASDMNRARKHGEALAQQVGAALGALSGAVSSSLFLPSGPSAGAKPNQRRVAL